ARRAEAASDRPALTPRPIDARATGPLGSTMQGARQAAATGEQGSDPHASIDPADRSRAVSVRTGPRPGRRPQGRPTVPPSTTALSPGTVGADAAFSPIGSARARPGRRAGRACVRRTERGATGSEEQYQDPKTESLTPFFEPRPLRRRRV